MILPRVKSTGIYNITVWRVTSTLSLVPRLLRGYLYTVKQWCHFMCVSLLLFFLTSHSDLTCGLVVAGELHSVGSEPRNTLECYS